MNLDKFFLRNGKSVFGEVEHKESNDQEVTAEEVCNSFYETLHKAFPSADTERKNGKKRTVGILIRGNQLSLDGAEVAAYMKKQGADVKEIINTERFYTSLGEGKKYPTHVEIPNDAYGPASWIEPYLYPAKLKTWGPQSSSTLTDKETGERISFTKITNGIGFDSVETTD